MDAKRNQLLAILIAGLKVRHGHSADSAPGLAELMVHEFERDFGRLCPRCGSRLDDRLVRTDHRHLLADAITFPGVDH